MSLPPFGGPPRAPTHQPLSQEQLMRMVQQLFEQIPDGRISAERLQAAAEAIDEPVHHLYAAAGFVPQFQFERTCDVVFQVCAGGCQQYGALEVIERLLSLRAARTAANQPAFDIHTRGCLDRCQQGAVVLVHTPDGVAGITQARPEHIDQVVSELFD